MTEVKNVIHKPVMINEAINYLNVRDGLTYLDVTFGRGGYSEQILKSANCKLIAIDRDPDVLVYSKKLKNNYKKRFSFILDSFNNLDDIIKSKNLKHINGGIIADLGISSMQIEDPKRGFSFMKNGPLDMRMDKKGSTAKDLIYSLNEKELSDILWKYGEERKSRAIAKAIVSARKTNNIETTFQLVELIKKVKKDSKKVKIHPATKTFQALRICVNQEIIKLKALLELSEKLLFPGARLVIVSFHSLEDRIIKVFFNELSGNKSNLNRHTPIIDEKNKNIIKFKKINKKPLFPTKSEVNKNKRARSAKIRIIERLSIGK